MHLLLPYFFSNSSISRATISTLLIFLMSVFVIVGTGDKFSSLELGVANSTRKENEVS